MNRIPNSCTGKHVTIFIPIVTPDAHTYFVNLNNQGKQKSEENTFWFKNYRTFMAIKRLFMPC